MLINNSYYMDFRNTRTTLATHVCINVPKDNHMNFSTTEKL